MLRFLNNLKFACVCIVVFCHYTLAFMPFVLSGELSKIHIYELEMLLRTTPLYTLVNGTFCVYVFWCISGFLIFYNYKRDSSDCKLVGSMMGRYLKPLALIFLSNLLAMILQIAGTMKHVEASAISHSEAQIASYYSVTPTIKKLLYETLVGNWFSENSLDFYNNPLWFMRLELIGTICLIVAIWVASKFRKKIVVYIIFALIIPIIDIRLICFLFGVIAAKYFLSNIKIPRIIGIVCVLVSVIFFAGNLKLINALLGKTIMYDMVNINVGHLFYSIGAMLMLLGVVIIAKKNNNKPYTAVSKKGPDFGNTSVYIYMLHWPILFSFSSALLVLCMNKTNKYALSLAIAGILGIGLTFIISLVVRKLIDAKWNTLYHKIIDKILI